MTTLTNQLRRTYSDDLVRAIVELRNEAIDLLVEHHLAQLKSYATAANRLDYLSRLEANGESLTSLRSWCPSVAQAQQLLMCEQSAAAQAVGEVRGMSICLWKHYRSYLVRFVDDMLNQEQRLELKV